MNRDKLKRVIEDIEATETAIKDLSAHKREVYAGVADEFEPKVLRKIIQRRKMDPESRTRDDDLLDQYESALGMTGNLVKAAASGDATYDEAAEAAGVSRRTMARRVAQAKSAKSHGNGTDPDGVILEGEEAGRGGETLLRTAIDSGCLLASAAGREPAAFPSTPPQPEHHSTVAVAIEDAGRPDLTPSGDAPSVGENSELQGRMANAKEGQRNTGDTVLAPPISSCGPCPVPPGSVAPTSDGNGLRTKGKAEPLADLPREHSSASRDGALAESVTTSQCEDRASPGPQDISRRIEAPPSISDEQAVESMLASAAIFARAKESRTTKSIGEGEAGAHT